MHTLLLLVVGVTHHTAIRRHILHQVDMHRQSPVPVNLACSIRHMARGLIAHEPPLTLHLLKHGSTRHVRQRQVRRTNGRPAIRLLRRLL